ncbi:Protein of unknown function (DUF4237) [Streptoalloteichus tenebrarius]|uniref:TNT domain-containing protein n=1 Tax=Streptoalloteichus tenebrarius (strain ATCC 17920 / DSM 40477 / JCM 4838 / CBS 697.72 / NBRC 16177 / NCIMB 11028 / NRRL B-12390 / A12253. 1 / ISP 5477) TaxID=1933 RepID=A0ABT1I185_STRSD|nr:glycohydrolase toxin TNT-related protein [Streptoalloteichus tenebrarius]MCP2261553.1 Protein of unknown function (DUF4237) [Streptoalloteichus tenebrarius]BFF02672.1 hypothetical protein GCM10020241_43470 [Streptoalloteichus tenebrarius]
MTSPQLTEEEQLALEQRCCRLLARVLPADWRELHFQLVAVHTADAHAYEVTRADGETVAGRLPDEVCQVLGELRERMYQPGRGTWFSVLGWLTPPNQARLRYEFDEEPAWGDQEPPAAFYAADLERFPRDPAAVPDWLRARLDEASRSASPAPAAPVPQAPVPQAPAPPAPVTSAPAPPVAVPERGPLDEAQQQALLTRIVDELRPLAPPGWERLRIVAQVVGYHGEFGMEVVGADGSAHRVDVPRPTAMAFLRLRSARYEPGAGTWFRMRVLVRANGELSVGYDHEEEPRWGRPPSAADVADELQLFPLPADRVPAWLSRLASSQEGVRGHSGADEPPAGQPSARDGRREEASGEPPRAAEAAPGEDVPPDAGFVTEPLPAIGADGPAHRGDADRSHGRQDHGGGRASHSAEPLGEHDRESPSEHGADEAAAHHAEPVAQRPQPEPADFGTQPLPAFTAPNADAGGEPPRSRRNRRVELGEEQPGAFRSREPRAEQSGAHSAEPDVATHVLPAGVMPFAGEQGGSASGSEPDHHGGQPGRWQHPVEEREREHLRPHDRQSAAPRGAQGRSDVEGHSTEFADGDRTRQPFPGEERSARHEPPADAFAARDQHAEVPVGLGPFSGAGQDAPTTFTAPPIERVNGFTPPEGDRHDGVDRRPQSTVDDFSGRERLSAGPTPVPSEAAPSAARDQGQAGSWRSPETELLPAPGGTDAATRFDRPARHADAGVTDGGPEGGRSTRSRFVEPPPAPVAEHVPHVAHGGHAPSEVAPGPAPGPAAAGQEPEADPWPTYPLPGEPPLRLYRDKRVATLPPDTEVDRFGGDGGNVVYAAATPFRQRSLPREWANRSYRVYRLRQFVEVVTGTAVPWFGQPGGGTAYVLPKAVDELLAEGVLTEIDAATTPPPRPRPTAPH